MPTENLLAIIAILAVFAFFIIMLAYVDWQEHVHPHGRRRSSLNAGGDAGAIGEDPEQRKA